MFNNLIILKIVFNDFVLNCYCTIRKMNQEDLHFMFFPIVVLLVLIFLLFGKSYPFLPIILNFKLIRIDV